MLLLILLVFSSLFYSLKQSSLAWTPNSHFDQPTPDENLLIRSWAPLVWLAPEESFLPLGVPEFLDHVQLSDTYLITKKSIDLLLDNSSSVLYGSDPSTSQVPVYIALNKCGPKGHFQVTYWLFFPYSQGKEVCTMDTSILGPVPIPQVSGRCLGTMREYGSHVGDWEHASLYFKGETWPRWLYVSAHDSGAFYKYDPGVGEFKYRKQERRRGGALVERPTFPSKVRVLEDADGHHPILFSAKGSHGLWAAPGKHKFIRIPRLYDDVGFGLKWETWNRMEALGDGLRSWMGFKGKWGNPRSDCHPLSNGICRHMDGPTGPPLKGNHFLCTTS